MKIKFAAMVLLTSCCAQTVAQDSIFIKQENEVIVTATRSNTKKLNISIPIQILNKTTIYKTGSLSLQNILQEQTGLNLVNSNLSGALTGLPNPFGQGIQMLGLDPAYTAILLDGEPLVGRNAGILKLSRIAIGNIQKVEIIKGPASSLYGSEALAGVINIITQQPQSKSFSFQNQIGSYGQLAQTAVYENKIKKTSFGVFGHRLQNNGYDLNKNIYGKTVNKFNDLNFGIKFSHQINSKLLFTQSIRSFRNKQLNDYQIFQNQTRDIVKGNTIEKDATGFSQLQYTLNNKNKFIGQVFINSYSNTSNVRNSRGVLFDETSTKQNLIKPELQYLNTQNNSSLIAGLGAYFEEINANRYAGKQNLQTTYAYIQNDWRSNNNTFKYTASIRVDKRNDFKPSLSPRFNISYSGIKNLKLFASAGSGFKAPDFRHLFLSLNNQQIGYSLIGNNVLSNQILSWQSLGIINSTNIPAAYFNIANLKPEKSFGFFVGAEWVSVKNKINLNIYRNDIKNLIDVYLLPFQKNDGSYIYSYQNINRVFSQGAEIDAQHYLTKNILIQAGYQFVEVKDKNIIEQLKKGTIFQRNPTTFVTTQTKRSDYFGLINRSKHTFNFKIDYSTNRFNIYSRFIYRGAYGLGDNNGNKIIDNKSEMVKGFLLWNTSAGFKINKQIETQVIVENILNHTNPQYQPNIPGRIYLLNFNYKI